VTGARAVALAGALLAAATPAAAHEVLHAVERGRAVALRAYFPDGEPLAYGEVEVFSPADARIPHQKGRTDRNGWVAFVPDVAGKWRVRVADATGHGLDVEIDAGPASGGASGGGGALATAAFVLRPLVGVACIAAIFGFLFIRHRRKRTP
jgi:nickel transport protein